MQRQSWIAGLLCLSVLFTIAGDAGAQSYPIRPIRLVVPFSAGGASDIVARILQPKVSEALGQQIIIDNRGGAAGIIGTEMVAKAPPDGYTLALVPTSQAINPGLYRRLPFDTINDFAAVALIDIGPLVLAVHPSLPVRSVKDLIGLAKQKPGQLYFPSGGIGSGSQLGGELFKSMAGVDMVHIPYKGLGPALVDLLSGQTHLVFSPPLPVAPSIKAGKLRALAVTTVKRSPVMPNLPTIADDIPGYEFISWHGVLAPAGTPNEIISRLHAAIVKALNSPQVSEKLSDQGLEPGGGTPEQFNARIRADVARYAKLIKALGLEPM